MRRCKGIVLCVLARLALIVGNVQAQEPVRVEMEILTEQGAPVTAQREWYELLTKLGVTNLQLRSARSGDQTRLESIGTDKRPAYRVVGIVTTRNELHVPGGRFAARDRGKISAWLKRLGEQGTAGAEAGRDLPFGMEPQKLQAIHDDLSQRVTISTKGKSLREVLDQLASGLAVPLEMNLAEAKALADVPEISEELQGVSTGTTLAYLLRSAGLVLVPRIGKDRQPQYWVTLPRRGQQSWPIGYPPEDSEPKLAPDLFKVHEVELDKVPLPEVLAAIQEQVKLPILYDHPALARAGVDIETPEVSMRPVKAGYRQVLQKVMFQAKLKEELRMDEAGQPILWVTSLLPPKAAKRVGE